jgi:hypothetical protein
MRFKQHYTLHTKFTRYSSSSRVKPVTVTVAERMAMLRNEKVKSNVGPNGKPNLKVMK